MGTQNPPTPQELEDLMVYSGATAAIPIIENNLNVLTPAILHNFSKRIYSEYPSEAPYRLNNMIWSLSKLWNKINYRCFLWALYANYNETIRSLHNESNVLTENSLFYKSEFSNVLQIEDDYSNTVTEDEIDFPVLPQAPTEKEYQFLFNLYLNNNHPLELYKYVRSQLTNDQIELWRSLCLDKIIISKIIHKDFWVMGTTKLISHQNEFLKTLCQRFMNISSNPNFELASYYEMNLNEISSGHKNYDQLEKLKSKTSQNAFDSLSIDEKRNILREACFNHLSGKTPLSLEFKRYIAIYNIKTSVEDNSGRQIAIFRLFPFVFSEITEFNMLFRGEVEQMLFKLYLIKRFPSFFKFLVDTQYFNLNWFIGLDADYQRPILKYYTPLVMKNLPKVYREGPEVMSLILDSFTNEEIEEYAAKYLTLAIKYNWNLSDDFLRKQATINPETILMFSTHLDFEILWIAAKACPEKAIAFIGHLLNEEQANEIRSMTS